MVAISLPVVVLHAIRAVCAAASGASTPQATRRRARLSFQRPRSAGGARPKLKPAPRAGCSSGDLPTACLAGRFPIFIGFFEPDAASTVPISDTLRRNRSSPDTAMKNLQIALPFWVRAILLVGVVCILAGAGLISYRYYMQPKTLTIAVGSLDGEAKQTGVADRQPPRHHRCAGQAQGRQYRQRARCGQGV